MPPVGGLAKQNLPRGGGLSFEGDYLPVIAIESSAAIGAINSVRTVTVGLEWQRVQPSMSESGTRHCNPTIDTFLKAIKVKLI